MEVELLIDKEKREQEIQITLDQFEKMLYVDFGLRPTKKLKEWFRMSWEEFKEELAKNKIRINECSLKDWESYFSQEKEKVYELQKDI